jgi:RNA-directed DNA polymerase
MNWTKSWNVEGWSSAGSPMKLRLKVNQQKSKVALSRYVKFLGMTIIAGTLAISNQSMQRATDKAKELIPRGTHLTQEQTMEAINKWYAGWAGYYEMTQYPKQLRRIEAHVRRRLRARIVDQQKKRRNLRKLLVKRGIPRRRASEVAFSHKKRWALSRTRALEQAFPNRWFRENLGQIVRSEDKLPHWFGVERSIKMA